MVVTIGPGEVLAQSVANGDVPGVVALAADSDGIVYQGAFGERELLTGVEMTLDTVFWIASMTKAVTSVAAMQLVEQGRLSLDSPLGDLLPALGRVQVLEGFDDSGQPRLRAPKRPVTLRRLLSHTAGFGYDIWNADLVRYAAHAGLPGIIECRDATFGNPLIFDPGDRWEYGINIDWVGKAVEAVSGQTLDVYMRERLFEPLGMRSTGFTIGADQRTRLAGMHARNADGSLTVIPFEVPQQPEFFMGGGGLYSTGPDYLTFLRMLLLGGTLDGVRILSQSTVDEMGRNQIGDLSVGALRTAIPASSNDHDPYPSMDIKWGLAYMITTESTPSGRSPNSLAWGGLANTFFWIDPTRRITGVLLTQILPFVDPRVMQLYANFERAIYGEST